jgi:hypothetical protein
MDARQQMSGMTKLSVVPAPLSVIPAGGGGYPSLSSFRLDSRLRVKALLRVDAGMTEKGWA